MLFAVRLWIGAVFGFWGFSAAARERRCGFRCFDEPRPWEHDVHLPIQREPECPCVRPKGSNQCVAYNPRKQAVTLDEALFQFPDLVSHDPNPRTLLTKDKSPPNGREGTISQTMIPQSAASPHAPMAAPAAFAAPSGSANNDLSCTKVDCMKCKLMVINSFLENCHNCSDVINAKMIEDQFELNKMLGGHDDCSYYKEKNLNMPKIQLASVNNEENKKNEEIADRLLNILNESSMMRRKKRNSDVELKEKMLGMTTEIDCNYKRGEQISPQSPWSGLCSVCWQWRKLPLIYWPPYLNEVSCNSKDNDCLAGYGRCRPVMSSLSVLKRIGPEADNHWEEVSIQTVVACECQVELGTALHSLVMR